MRLRRILSVLAILCGVSLIGTPSASAHNDFPWTGCSYSWFLDANVDIWVRTEPTADFPSNSFGDGVLNSFVNRITESISQLDISLQSAGVSGGAIQIYDTRPEDVLLRYVNIASITPFGRTIVRQRNSTPVCPYVAHSATGFENGLTTVEINQRSDWFTQENNRRSTWEACSPGNPSYTCSKWFDFGSTTVHELLHGLTLLHPQDVDRHTGASPSDGPEAQQAHCNSTVAWDGRDDASICPAGGDAPTSESRYESSRRSVEGYDVSSVSAQYFHN